MQNNSQKGGVGIWFIIIIVIIAGVWMFYNYRNTRAVAVPHVQTEPIAQERITITYDANGFSPNTVTIKKGGMVIFQNKTGKPASVASGAHPTHLLYPEFDQYKTEQRGKDEFRFVFEKVGTWKYHDHLNSTMTGTIIVE